MKKNTNLFVLFALMFTTTFVSANSEKDPEKKQETEVIVHVYRPSNIVGFATVFNLRANGEKIGKIKNGKDLILRLKPGKTTFKVRRKTVNIELEAGKTYYLRTVIVRNMLLGKPDLVEVTESQAKNELSIK